MNRRFFKLLLIFPVFLFVFPVGSFTRDTLTIHTWEMLEISLHAKKTYDNPYTDVTCWVDLTGPGFSKRIYGFWDGNNEYKIR